MSDYLRLSSDIIEEKQETIVDVDLTDSGVEVEAEEIQVGVQIVKFLPDFSAKNIYIFNYLIMKWL